MTFEQRMAELGVDLSDLPDEHSIEQCATACIEAGKWAKYTDHTVPFDFILHLTDVIDRMETRLVNVTGELEWLKKTDHDLRGCYTCMHRGTDDPECDDCEPFEDSQYAYSGVPEDWKPDDEP